MPRYGMIIQIDRCAGCFSCQVACKEENKVAPGIFYERIHREENPEAMVVNWFRVSCMHCDEQACMPICPAKAIYRGPAGEVLVDHEKCIGCTMCAMACPYGAPMFNRSGRTSYFGDREPLQIVDLEPWQKHRKGRAEHCTLCTHRTSKGRPPACVEACGIGALTWVDYDNPTEKTAPLIVQILPDAYVGDQRFIHSGKDLYSPSKPKRLAMSC